jgi:CheY-like chemotaxis protein
MRILILDDQPEFREVVAAMLSRSGHSAEGVARAEDAIPLVESGAYDFVFVDYSMPEHDGLWFMSHVKRPRHTKALLMTAHVDHEVIRTMFKIGACGYLIKPFEEDDLNRHLEFYAGQGG